MNVVYQKLLVNVTSEKYIYKNVFIESSCQFSFLRCQEYDFNDFVDLGKTMLCEEQDLKSNNPLSANLSLK